jgi:hypothetical protein
MLLFKVSDKFMVTGLGPVLTPGLGDKKAAIGDKIKIIRPDGSVIYTIIRGISLFSIQRGISVGADLTKDDVPIDSEIWLSKD